jgi:hypothetical protein
MDAQIAHVKKWTKPWRGFLPHPPIPTLDNSVNAIFTQAVFENYIPRPASRLYISSASCLESGASAIRSKIDSNASPRLYALTTCVCRNVFGVNSFSTDIEQVQTAKKSFTFR